MLPVLTRNILKLQIISIIILAASTNYFAQQSSLSKAVNSISSYIASNHFADLKRKIGDLSASDSIFFYALNFCDGNMGDALLALMLATVPYREVPIELPIINSIVYYPLVSADEETFIKKNNHLPKYLFLDTPTNNYGDKDKLAHFFGSAFLSYESNIFDLGKLIGYFVEVFEESFKVQSSIDPRDLDVNYYGRFFGETLKENKQILPSQILLLRSLRYLRITL